MARVPAAKRRRLSPPDDQPAAAFSRTSAKWDAEQDYETRPRTLDKRKETGRLPIKTAEGWVAPVVEAEPEASGDEDEDSFLGTSSDDDDEDEAPPPAPKVPARQQILQAKEELARLASLINEDPEEHAGVLRQLATLAGSDNVTVKKLALATQLTVYKDIIPGYRIRPVSEDELKQKLSKDVRQLRNYEQSLVHGYQEYVKDLAASAKGSKGGASEAARGLATVAISCACNLLTAVPHFNFRGEVLKILVDKLSGRSVDADFVKCRETLETLFETDEDGHASLDAVTMLTKMFKGRQYHVHESVLNTFLHLRLLSEFAGKASFDRVDTPGGAAEGPKGKKPREKKEFRTKKQRKLLKEHKVIENEMKEADAAVSHEERDRMQAETLKLVFVTYFRILKARTPALMGAVLEGLARYAHLINQDFFGDILEALKDLIREAEAAADDSDADDEDADDDADEADKPVRNATRESLLCVITAFALLQGQDASKAASALHLDLSFFIAHLYRTLYPIALNPDIELSATSLHLPDPSTPAAAQPSTAENKVNATTTAVLLLRSLASTLSPRTTPPVRLAAFVKQLHTLALQLPEKSAAALTALLAQLAKTHARRVGALWDADERRGDGVWDPLAGDLERSNPFACTVWEGELLRLHFSPRVREGVEGVARGVRENR
ncbi:uncharacterized protein K452DRAFT_349999 [Aplosporella prunicola CBS 121167]|uniref:Nucleolar complex-associated protein 3 n=1 Tax=Aplosporella prunicola CBS 121167 TaxID=1176127 RepID=A0A6A6BN89_9PEZI|nr:uncharacterized protein K452DRAFT_349999 [Aplosporella prunicola CBS 121167]KAF2144297.1 hypothetical protein K452DRAFT_349999 [Aplosporella prunicola CBS 121167]